MDKPTIYIETSIASYLAARPAGDPITAANQRLTHRWWNTRRHEYDLYTSELVVLEADQGDPEMATRRIALLKNMPMIQVGSPEILLAQALQTQVPLPAKALEDALHIATAAVGGLRYLLTWDRKHIANPRLEARIRRIILAGGYSPPVLCTPRDLMEND